MPSCVTIPMTLLLAMILCVLTTALQAQSKLEGVLSGIGGSDGGEALEWELPSEDEQEQDAPSSDMRSTEEWKQYVATYGQSYTERYFASYYHAQVGRCPSPCTAALSPLHCSKHLAQRLTLCPDAASVRRSCRPRLPQAQRSAYGSFAVKWASVGNNRRSCARRVKRDVSITSLNLLVAMRGCFGRNHAAAAAAFLLRL
jgi:hypothetical protein